MLLSGRHVRVIVPLASLPIRAVRQSVLCAWTSRNLQDRATPLYIASERGHIEVVKILLEEGANVEYTFQVLGGRGRGAGLTV